MSELTPELFANQLHGREYRGELTSVDGKRAKDAGLVVVFGASDDLMEFRGAIDDERGTQGALIDAKGLLPYRDEIDNDKDLRDYFARDQKASKIKPVWSEKGGPCWTYETDIPHATFDVTDAGELYCRGIVFRLADCGASGIVWQELTGVKDIRRSCGAGFDPVMIISLENGSTCYLVPELHEIEFLVPNSAFTGDRTNLDLHWRRRSEPTRNYNYEMPA